MLLDFDRPLKILSTAIPCLVLIIYALSGTSGMIYLIKNFIAKNVEIKIIKILSYSFKMALLV